MSLSFGDVLLLQVLLLSQAIQFFIFFPFLVVVYNASSQMISLSDVGEPPPQWSAQLELFVTYIALAGSHIAARSRKVGNIF